jgi:hypothetical protein
VTVTDFSSDAVILLEGHSSVSEKDPVRASVARETLSVLLSPCETENERLDGVAATEPVTSAVREGGMGCDSVTDVEIDCDTESVRDALISAVTLADGGCVALDNVPDGSNVTDKVGGEDALLIVGDIVPVCVAEIDQMGESDTVTLRWDRDSDFDGEGDADDVSSPVILPSVTDSVAENDVVRLNGGVGVVVGDSRNVGVSPGA